MEDKLSSRFTKAWNAFFNLKQEPFMPNIYESGYRYSTRPDRTSFTTGTERSIIASIYNRLALDVAAISVQHVRIDDNGRFSDSIKSNLNYCLTERANIDQTARAFIQDAVLSLFDEGSIAIVPVETTINPLDTEAYDVLSMRVGKILEWFPKSVRVRLYNERTGLHEEITIPKRLVAIVENPHYAVMNETNSTLKRLIAKLNLLDVIDNQTGSGKLDLIIQLPYVIKSEARKAQAEERRLSIQDQLKNSEFGIAYTDGTENVIQLNRPAENNLMGQIQFLTSMLYSQLGITESVQNGTADEKVMKNYMTRSVEPVLGAIIDAMNTTFLSRTARSQGQRIMMFPNNFKLVPIADLAELGDKFTRNEILTGNEVRSIIGLKPAEDPSADELRNKNINQPDLQKGGPNIYEQTDL